tara:strand:- start:197 stop:1366 length:1170 start_codon:yes stop_codon:yes gene_type:complete
MIYSAAFYNQSVFIKSAWLKQVNYAIGGALISLSLVYLPKNFLYSFSYSFYLINVIGLTAVLAWGTGDDAQRWLRIGLVQIQPSEFSKIATLLLLARYLSGSSIEELNSLTGVAKSFGIVIIPMILIIQQPDLGTALAFAAPLLPMLYWAGMRKAYLFALISPFISVVCSFEPLWLELAPYVFAFFIVMSSLAIQIAIRNSFFTSSAILFNLTAGLATVYLWDHFLRPYQKDRIITFLDPESDRLGTGWNIIQSKIAIGSGGFFGKGFLGGTQTKYDFLPAAHTDFVFSVIGEELGYIGALLVIISFFILIVRTLQVGKLAKNRYHSLIAVGIASIFTFHVFVNIGMTIGVMPVTGLPLPFISAGGSSLLANLVIIGISLHIFANRHEY